jgi:IS5 family transposase
MLGARTFPGNLFDGHILSAALEQATNLTQDVGVELKHIVVDLGFRGVDADNPGKEIIHRGRYKSLSEQQKRWLKRPTAVEPANGHLKSDYRMDRCWLQGALGDALHAISCAAGYNLCRLMRAIARMGIGIVLLRVLLAALTPTSTLHTAYATLIGTTGRLIEKFQTSKGGQKSEIQLTHLAWI